MHFQILDANYVYDMSGYPVVQLFGIRDNGDSIICRVSGFRPYFYASAHDITSAAEAVESMDLDVEIVERYEPIGYQSKPIKMLRIIAKDPKSVREIRDRVREIPSVRAVYETDILFKNRFLIDTGLGGMAWVKVLDVERDSTSAKESRDGLSWYGLANYREVERDSTSAKESRVLEGCEMRERRRFIVDVPVEKLAPEDLESTAPLRFMSFDIECLPQNGEMPRPESSPVILISMAFHPPYHGMSDLVLVGRELECDRPDVEGCADERALISRFVSVIDDYDPDIIAGYNSNEFDIPYLRERASRLGIEMNVGRDGSTWLIRSMGSNKNVAVTGRVVVDLLPIIRSSFSLKQYTLRNAAMELIGEEKRDMDPARMESIWLGGDGLADLIRYSRRDAVLVMQLLLRLRLMDKYIALARVSGSLLQDIVNGGQSGMVENLILRRFRSHKRVLPPKPDSEESGERFTDADELKGGAVLPPVKGLVENVVILDYKSLYPTIMMAHNLCYSTVVTKERPPEVVKSPSGGYFASPSVCKGIVPEILRELLEKRTETKMLMKSAGEDERAFLDAKQYALKILLNSFYGYSGYARARLYSLTLANAVTSFGRHNILRTKEMIEEIGSVYIVDGKALLPEETSVSSNPKPPDTIELNSAGRRYDLSVVYGDTDSVFVRISSGYSITPEDAELIGRKIAETITSKLPKPMELVFEAFARRAIFLAKKRYALWLFERVSTQSKPLDGVEGSSKTPSEGSGIIWRDRIKVRGMETVRRDWCDLTSKTLRRCLELILKEGRVDDAVQHVRDVIQRLRDMDIRRDRELLDDLVLTRRFTKDPSSYRNKQPHIQLVEKMRRRGGRVPGVGDRVPFIIVKGGKKTLFVDRAEDPEYAVENNLPIDTEYYIEKQLLPPVLRLFMPFDVDRESLLQCRSQKNLLHFDQKAQRQRTLLDF
ncbi:DNA-directed DNA polymerase [Methanothrix thermoacetophila]|uniref:DNA polymerase n=1 Tax=Methanothrix thermoacetophila (strain DSM 6194 / JCM 14653 / NBRC 101360 / PT) TaxID=349307 RepID=A0B8Z8_METTP|nr:DNA-directed DNA polymerase [Methanothrix thermoacetophila]ABK15172.1 replicative DNA polymerase I [Methanothrix thermoacetophila PT]